MGIWLWTFYFAVKLWLHLGNVIAIHFWPNLALLLIAMPLTRASGFAPRWIRILRQAVAIPFGVGLLWYDSYLPPFLYSIHFLAQNIVLLSGGFVFEFARGFLASPGSVLVVVILMAVLFFASRNRIHPTPIVLLALMVVLIQGPHLPPALIAKAAARFYSRESIRVVSFDKDASTADFDIVIVQICSLSWDDLGVVGQPHPRLFDRANVLFTNFNSATSYSTPAGLRLLRGSCGQVANSDLYDPWPRECFLIDQLRNAGYHTYAAFNTEPEYYGMSAGLTRMAHLDAPIPVKGVPEQMLSFDNQPVYQNGSLLGRWLALRQKDSAPRAMLFYNSISLHGGGHWDRPGGWNIKRAAFYAKALDDLGNDVQAFEDALAKSGHSAVVMIVPEHGAALRGSPIQAADLRDIPLPSITLVPVAVRFIGPLFADMPVGLEVQRPSSYLALATMLSELRSDPSIASDSRRLQRMLDELPETDFMSETQHWKIFRLSEKY